MGWWILYTLAAIGGLLGLAMLWLHLTTDPLVDVRAYYDAARRLNDGQPLYAATGGPTSSGFWLAARAARHSSWNCSYGRNTPRPSRSKTSRRLRRPRRVASAVSPSSIASPAAGW